MSERFLIGQTIRFSPKGKPREWIRGRIDFSEKMSGFSHPFFTVTYKLGTSKSQTGLVSERKFDIEHV